MRAAGDRGGAAVRSSLMGKARKTPSQGLSSDAPHGVEFFQRYPDDDPAASAPGFDFLIACPPKVQATMLAVPQGRSRSATEAVRRGRALGSDARVNDRVA